MASPSRESEKPSRPRSTSLVRSSAVGALADASALFGGLVTAIATARWLGPAGKGALSVLLLIGHGFFFYSLALGMGDAAIFLIKGRNETVQRALSASLPVLGASSLLGMALLFLVSVPADWTGISTSVLIAGLGLAAWIHFEFLTGLLNAQERIPLTSSVRALVSLATTVATIVLIGVFELGVVGGVFAVLASVSMGLAWMTIVLLRDGFSFRPRWDPAYLRTALRFGIPIQFSYLLLVVAQRFDQLVVYSLRGEADGGRYSVALTMGWLITYLPVAITRAAFPRLAEMKPKPARDLLAQMLRVNLLASIAAGMALIVALPILVRFFLGDVYRASVIPALVLLAGGIVWSLEWILAKSAAARGRPGLLVVTLLANFLVMLGLDLFLIPRFGIIGAAYASLSGATFGLLVSILFGAGEGLTIRMVIPGRADVRQTAKSLRGLISSTERSVT